MQRIEVEPLHEKVQQALLEMFRHFVGQKLPTEVALAEDLGVSRSTVREAMSELRRKGYIVKRKGKGNFLLRSVLETDMRIDLTMEFAKLIEEAGHEPSLSLKLQNEHPATETEQRRLGLTAQDTVYTFHWDYRADGRSAFLVWGHVPKKLFLKPYEDRLLVGVDAIRSSSTFGTYCGQDVSHTLLELDAGRDAQVADQFGIESDRCLMIWKQLFYNIYDELLGYGDIYINPEIIHMTMCSEYYYRP